MINNLSLQVREGMRSTENHFPWKHPAQKLLHILHPWGKLSSLSETPSSFLRTLKKVFQKSMVGMLHTAHRQRKQSTKFKIIWLRQHQQMKVIFSHEGRELKSLIKTNMKWTARKVTSTVKCILWALSRRSKYFQGKKGRQIIICDKRKRQKI